MKAALPPEKVIARERAMRSTATSEEVSLCRPGLPGFWQLFSIFELRSLKTVESPARLFRGGYPPP